MLLKMNFDILFDKDVSKYYNLINVDDINITLNNVPYILTFKKNISTSNKSMVNCECMFVYDVINQITNDSLNIEEINNLPFDKLSKIQNISIWTNKAVDITPVSISNMSLIFSNNKTLMVSNEILKNTVIDLTN